MCDDKRHGNQPYHPPHLKGSGKISKYRSSNRVENNNQVFGKGLGLHNPANSHKDSGGASRYFKQVHSLEELKEYLIALIRC